MYTQEEDVYVGAVMVRDGFRKLPELRAIASSKYPGLPLSEMGIRINYRVVPTTFDIFPLHDFRTLFSPDSGFLDNLTSVISDDFIRDVRLMQRTLFVGEIFDGKYSSNIPYVMKSLLWDNSEFDYLDRLVGVSRPSANDLGSERTVDGLQGTWQLVGRRTEMGNPKLRKRIESLVKEERRRWSDVQGTWLTA